VSCEQSKEGPPPCLAHKWALLASGTLALALGQGCTLFDVIYEHVGVGVLSRQHLFSVQHARLRTPPTVFFYFHFHARQFCLHTIGNFFKIKITPQPRARAPAHAPWPLLRRYTPLAAREDVKKATAQNRLSFNSAQAVRMSLSLITVDPEAAQNNASR